ncbi:MAG: hypothetical protein JST93_01880 [Acidobacteria bacterium]|nr:hypothetical protein [Acidobacteriota bacterium]
MAIQIPSIDDLSYEQLVDALRRQIPPGLWTDHNPSDPGIMLMEQLCWIGEMVLYRMNRVPETHETRFLNLIIDPPEPVTVDVTFTATFPAPPAPTAQFTIPAGTRLATNYANGRRFVFETIESLTLVRPGVAPWVSFGTVRARAILEVLNEPLGISDNTPHQTFALRPPRQALGLGADDPAPLLLDFAGRTASYEPNPQITVAGVPWTAVPSLLTEFSRINLPLNEALHCMFQPYERTVRFGDGVYGAIPPAGSLIECARYLVLEGPRALALRRGDLIHVLNLTVPAGMTLAFAHTDAEGGANFFPPSRRFELGLKRFRDPFRLVTAADFEQAVLVDFNEFQSLSGASPKIARASAVMNRRPDVAGDEPAPGYVTFILLAEPPFFNEAQFQDETVPFAIKDAMVDLPSPLWERIRRFLDGRRLITTRLRRMKPGLTAFRIDATVVVDTDRNVAEMERQLRALTYGFLSLRSGGFDGAGWPLGRSVYRSQLFRLLEDAAGVDHVSSLVLSPSDPQGTVILAPNELPLLEMLTLAIVRA